MGVLLPTYTAFSRSLRHANLIFFALKNDYNLEIKHVGTQFASLEFRVYIHSEPIYNSGVILSNFVERK